MNIKSIMNIYSYYKNPSPYYIHQNALHLSRNEINRLYLMTHQLYTHNIASNLYNETLLTNSAMAVYNRSFL
jgi:hypothetical protein